VRSRNQAAKRRALSRYPLNRAKYLLYAGAAKQTAAPNARLNKVVHMSRSYDCRGSATDLSATGLLRTVAGGASRNRVYPISAALGAQVG
jgi:hypothetical protein